MNKNRLLSIGFSCFGAVALVMLVALTIQISGVNSQGPDESEIEANAALAAEQNPSAAEAIQVNPAAGMLGGNPLFAGVDDAAIPAILMDVTNGTHVNAFSGVPVWGAAYNYDDNIVYFNNGTALYEWPVGGTPNLLGTMVNGAGAAQSLVSLAYYNGVLYGTKNIAVEAVHVVNPVSLVVTPTIIYATGHDMGGFSIDPDTGTMYATDDGTTDSLVIINPDGSVTAVGAYPTGETDVDGLAVGGGYAYMVTDNANGAIYVYNLTTNAYETPLVAPWPTSETFSAGAWVEMVVSQPGISLTKTVGSDPNTCALTTAITVTQGSDVTYCYEVTNTGDVTLTVHELDDSELGTILTGFPFTLVPGASAFLTATENILTDTTNVATWTACNIDGAPTLTCFDGAAFDVVSATATADVTVIPPPPTNPSINLTKTVGLDNTMCAASNNLTVDDAVTEVYYCYAVVNTGDVTFTIHDLDDSVLGSILNAFPYVLGPGEDVFVYPVTATLSGTVTNVATWTAYVDTALFVTDTATATVTVTDGPTDVALNSFTGSSNPLLLPLMAGLMVLLVTAVLFFIRRFQPEPPVE